MKSSGEATGGLYRLLSLPLIYDCFQSFFKSNDFHRMLVRDWLRLEPGMRILDVGCGTGALAPYLPEGVHYLGIDSNPAYIRQAQQRCGSEQVRFLCAKAQDLKDFVETPFDRITILGVLHHLPDEICQQLMAELHPLLSPSGLLLTVDVCYHARQSRLARLLTSLDRGQHVRWPAGYVALAQGPFEHLKLLRSHFLWVTRLVMLASDRPECLEHVASQPFDLPLNASDSGPA